MSNLEIILSLIISYASAYCTVFWLRINYLEKEIFEYKIKNTRLQEENYNLKNHQ